MEKASLMAKLSKLSYLKFEKSDIELKDELLKLGFSLEALFIDFDVEKGTGTQAFMAANLNFRTIVFRGTENDGFDILTDLKAVPKEIDGGRVHSGFWLAYKSIEPEVEKALKDKDNLPLIVAGHSLGGALAMISALRLGSEVSEIYTFGAPAIATIGVMRRIEAPIYRFVNSGDIVPRVMKVGPFFVYVVIVIVRAVEWFVSKVFKKQINGFDDLVDFLKALKPVLRNYKHISKSLIIQGGQVSEIDSELASWRIFENVIKDSLEAAIEDHRIALYVDLVSSISFDETQMDRSNNGSYESKAIEDSSSYDRQL